MKKNYFCSSNSQNKKSFDFFFRSYALSLSLSLSLHNDEILYDRTRDVLFTVLREDIIYVLHL